MTQISANNEILHGSLELSDDSHPNRLGAVKDDYTLVDFTPGNAIKLELFSEEFDAYLQLINSDTGTIIAENDDFNDISNSQLTFIPEDHINYLVRVTSYGSSETGNYTLSSDNHIDVDLVIEDADFTIVTYDESSTNLEFSDTYYDPYYNEAYINLDLSLTVKNLGTETTFVDLDGHNYYNTSFSYYPYSSGWADTVYLSSDEHFDPLEDLWVAEISRDEDLEGGESYTTKFEANLYKPNLWGREDHYLIFVADSNNTQYETDEHNNTFAIPIDLNLTPPDVDLIVTDAQVTGTPYYNGYGETYLDLSLTITNQGSEAAFGLGGYDYYYGSNLYSTVYLSSDQHFDPIEDYWVADFWHDGNLGAGQSHTAYTTAYFSDYYLQQTEDKYLIFVADGYNYQQETDEHNNTFTIPLDIDLTSPYSDHVFATPIYRYQNQDVPGTYLFLGEEEGSAVHANFPNFVEEGMAFNVGNEPQDDLIGMYRFQSIITPGTYIYVGEEERTNIHQNYSDSFVEEGLSFYVYGAGEGRGTTIYRFRNTDSNLGSNYLFATGEEAEYIRHNFPEFIEEGAAFEALV